MSIRSTTLADEIATGDSLRIIDLARRFNLNQSTVFRWAFKGLQNEAGERVRLEVIRFGKSWKTSEAAFRRFLNALPMTPAPAPQPVRTPRKRERDSAGAKQALSDKYGIS
jgi:hypothetical protein